MPWGDLLDDTTGDDIVGDLTPRPLSDRSSCLSGCLTGQGGDLEALLRGDLWLHSRAWSVLQALHNAQRIKVDPLQADPAISPQAGGVHVDRQLPGNLRIGLSLPCG